MIVRLPIGLLGSNCYIIFPEDHGEAAVVDPGMTERALAEHVLQEHDLRLRYVLNTHGHFDHAAGNGLFVTASVILGIHVSDRPLLMSGGGAPSFGLQIASSPTPTLDLKEDTTLTLTAPSGATCRISVIETPGHTPGSICLYITPDAALITGDTLFAGTVGRTDLPGGDPRALSSSLHKLLGFAPNTRILPGHGETTVLQRELRVNPWLRRLSLTRRSGARRPTN